MPLAWLATLAFGFEGCQSGAPCYSETSIVNSASNVAGDLAPNTIATIYGKDLAYSTRALSAEDIRGGNMPTQLGGVAVHVGAGTAPLYYVSPTQINCVIPGNLLPGPADLQIVREGRAGPPVRILLQDAAPAFFRWGDAVASGHADGAPVTPERPARPGEAVVLYATGLGPIVTGLSSNYTEIPQQAAPLVRFRDLKLLVDGTPLEPARVPYAGVAPGFLGLYQVNVVLPDAVALDPPVRIGFGDRLSPEGVKLPLQPLPVQAHPIQENVEQPMSQNDGPDGTCGPGGGAGGQAPNRSSP